MSVIPLGHVLTAGRDPRAALAEHDGIAIPFGRFANEVARTAAAVRARGAARGAILADSPYGFLVALFALLHAGAVAVLPPDALPATLAGLSDRFDVLLSDAPPPGVLALPIGHGPPGAPFVTIAPSAPLEFYTSASTGSAKRITKPLAALDHEIATLDRVWGDSAGRPVLSTVSYRHIFGLVFHLLWPVASARPFADHVDALWESLLARGTAGADIITSPAHLARLGGLAPLPPARRPIRVFTAGAPLPARAACEATGLFGVTPTEIFGSTETGAIATRGGADEPWTPLHGNRISAAPDGTMIVTSPYAPTAASADRIELLDDGRFHFLGRADRIAKIEGKRVSLAALEAALAALPDVADAATLVLDPPRLAAAVVPSASGAARLAALGPFRFSRELRHALGQTLEPAWLPRAWRFVAALPVAALGKRRAADIKALFE